MNYITEIKAFYDRLETNPLPSPAIALWHALMHTANKTGWQQEFTVAVSVLTMKSGLNDQAVKRARNKLKQSGLIQWEPRGGNQSAAYQMKSLVVQNEVQNVPQSVPQHEPQYDPQSEPINKLNETKQINNILRVRAYYENHIGVLNKTISTSLEGYLDRMDPEVIEKAISIAAGKGVSNWKYISTILADWIEKQILKADDLKKLEKKAGKNASDMPDWMKQAVDEAEVEER